MQAYINNLREAGAPVNTAIVIAAGNCIVMDKASDTFIASLDIYLTKDWAKYLMKHIGMVKREGPAQRQDYCNKFWWVKGNFSTRHQAFNVTRWDTTRTGHKYDQTGIQYVPVSSWSMETKGAKRVKVVGKDDKHQITAIFGISMSGGFLSIQLVYQGKTTKCLPSFDFQPKLGQYF